MWDDPRDSAQKQMSPPERGFNLLAGRVVAGTLEGSVMLSVPAAHKDLPVARGLG